MKWSENEHNRIVTNKKTRTLLLPPATARGQQKKNPVFLLPLFCSSVIFSTNHCSVLHRLMTTRDRQESRRTSAHTHCHVLKEIALHTSIKRRCTSANRARIPAPLAENTLSTVNIAIP
ncbi:unnamed protein product [Ectocarpus sp. 12 AP-2014]